MQTGLPLLDLSISGASFKGQKTLPGATKPATEPKPDQLAGFMEIMSALMALPPEQWKQSLTELDEMAADGGTAPLPCPVGNSGKNMLPSELLKLIVDLKGEVLKKLQTAEAGDSPNPLLETIDGDPLPILEIAQALMADPQMASLNSEAATSVKAPQGTDPETVLPQAVHPPLSLLKDAPVADDKKPVFPGLDPEAGKDASQFTPEAAMDGKSNSRTDREESPKTSRQTNQPDAFLFKTSDAKAEEDAPQPHAFKETATSTAETAKAPAEDFFPDEKGTMAEKTRQALVTDNFKNSAANTQTPGDGKNLQERFAQRLDPPAGGYQELQWRPETGRESKPMALSEGKEVIAQEKASPSDVIRQIVQRMSMQTIGDQSKMVIRLKPEFLGNVHMHIVTENQQVTVRMMADSTLVKDIVEQNLPHLRAELQHHGLEIQKFDVFVANDEQGWRGGQEQAGFTDARNQKQSRPNGGKGRRQNAKIMLNSGDRKKIAEKDPGDIDYFA